MSYSNNWLQTLKESYMAEAKAEFENHDDCVEHFKSNGMSAADAQRKCHALSRNEESRKDNFREEVELTNDLVAIIQALCEEAGVNMKELMEAVEMSRRDFSLLHKASGWDKPAPKDAPHGSVAAAKRDAILNRNKAILGTRAQREAIPAGPLTAAKIEAEGEDGRHEPKWERRQKGAPASEINVPAFDKMQDSIEKIGDKVTIEDIRQRKEDAKRDEMKRIMDAVNKSKSGKKSKQ